MSVLNTEGDTPMSSEHNKAIARRLYDQVWSQGNMTVADEIFTADVIDHASPPGSPSGLAGVKQVFGMYRGAFPDLVVTAEDLIADGDKVVARWTSRGTHRGDLMGMSPTGKQVSITGIDILRFEGDKIAEHWANFDMLGMLQQLGVAPGPS
jgi:steroid delta-isomerase-like uncharacterized protein